MRRLGLVVVVALAAGVSPAAAQSALAATGVDPDSVPATALITLRPSDGLEALAERVADMLELRTGQHVAVGDAPPPELLEAVPAGHVAMAQDGARVLLVLGAPGGRSYDTEVLVRDGGSPSDVRALAMGVEAMRDEAVGMAYARTSEPAPEPGEAASTEAPSGARPLRGPTRDAGEPGANGATPRDPVRPFGFARLYTGASAASSGPMAGLGAGVGLCLEAQCLVLGGELPFTGGSAQDVRYRYTSFFSGIYLRPLGEGARWTPGATLVFLTRLGHFEQDMGLADSGLRSDLAARGALDLALTVTEGLDVMVEGGVDYTIDGHLVSSGDVLISRGDRWSPWAQTALRYRP